MSLRELTFIIVDLGSYFKVFHVLKVIMEEERISPQISSFITLVLKLSQQGPLTPQITGMEWVCYIFREVSYHVNRTAG